jgi:hypothetical protein
MEKERIILPGGDVVMRWKGAAAFRYEGHIGGGSVLFGEPGDATLVGWITLGSLGFTLDPLRRVLKPIPMLLAVEAHA